MCLGVFVLFGFFAHHVAGAPLRAGRVAEAAGNAYYVSPDGSDSNPGTATQPWRTIQKAANTMVAGDTCFVRSGDYGERVQVRTSGATGAPISYQAVGFVAMKGFTIKASYINIQGFDITGTVNDPVEGWGIYVQGDDCLIEDNYIFDCVRGGIKLEHKIGPGEPAPSSYCIVRNNRLYHNSQVGVDVRGRQHLIEGNEVWRTVQYHPDWSDPPWWVDADGMRFFGSGHVFRQNYIHDIWYTDPENHNPHIDCFQTWSSSTDEVGHEVTFDGNVCKIMQPLPESGGAAQGWISEGGYDLILRNNIVDAYITAGFYNSSGCRIVNNTFLGQLLFSDGTGSNGVQLSNSPNMTIKNNIFYDISNPGVDAKDSQSLVGLEADYNNLYRSDGRSPRGTRQPNDLWGVDPQFVDAAGNNFHLDTASPCIDRGTNLLDLVPDDLDGNARPHGFAYDIGAFEYVGVVSGPGILVLDDSASNFATVSGQDAWLEGTDLAEQRYGSSYQYNQLIGSGSDTATWTFTVTIPGDYDVYAWWCDGSQRPGDVPYTVHHAGGSSTVRVDQRSNGGQWNWLGSFRFDGPGSVVVADNASFGSDILADAVKLVFQWPNSSFLPAVMH